MTTPDQFMADQTAQVGGPTTTPAPVTNVLSEREAMSLGDRMKSYEQQTNMFLDPTKPFIIRIDGS